MEIQALTPMLRTWDIEASVAFYTSVLGFSCDRETRNFAWLRRDRAELMLSGPNHHEGASAPAFTGSLYFRISGVDEYWLKVKDRVKVCYEIETFD